MKLAEMEYVGPWQIPIACKRCLCPDGKRRYIRITSLPDTYFSIPGRMKYRGKSISGFVTGRETDTFERDYEFIPYKYGKNYSVIAKATEGGE